MNHDLFIEWFIATHMKILSVPTGMIMFKHNQAEMREKQKKWERKISFYANSTKKRKIFFLLSVYVRRKIFMNSASRALKIKKSFYAQSGALKSFIFTLIWIAKFSLFLLNFCLHVWCTVGKFWKDFSEGISIGISYELHIHDVCELNCKI